MAYRDSDSGAASPKLLVGFAFACAAVLGTGFAVYGVPQPYHAGIGAEEQWGEPYDPSLYDEFGNPVIEPPKGWSYWGKPDEIRGGFRDFATLASENKAFLEPSGEEASLRLQFGRLTGGDTFANIYFENQMLGCDGTFCPFAVSFDGKRDTVLFHSIPQFRMLEAYDGEGLARRILASKRFVIEVPVINRGSEQFVFDVAGLQWDLPSRQPPVLAPPSSPTESIADDETAYDDPFANGGEVEPEASEPSDVEQSAADGIPADPFAK